MSPSPTHLFPFLVSMFAGRFASISSNVQSLKMVYREDEKHWTMTFMKLPFATKPMVFERTHWDILLRPHVHLTQRLKSGPLGCVAPGSFESPRRPPGTRRRQPHSWPGPEHRSGAPAALLALPTLAAYIKQLICIKQLSSKKQINEQWEDSQKFWLYPWLCSLAPERLSQPSSLAINFGISTLTCIPNRNVPGNCSTVTCVHTTPAHSAFANAQAIMSTSRAFSVAIRSSTCKTLQAVPSWWLQTHLQARIRQTV